MEGLLVEIESEVYPGLGPIELPPLLHHLQVSKTCSPK